MGCYIMLNEVNKMQKLAQYRSFNGERYEQYGVCFSARDRDETMARIHSGGKYRARSVKGPKGKYAMWTLYVRKR